MNQTISYADCTRRRILRKWLTERAKVVPQMRVLEIGRLRSRTEIRGHSTLHIACHPAVAVLVSVDHNPKTEAVARDMIPGDALRKVQFVNEDSVEWMGEYVGADGEPFDFFYLDGLNDAEHVLAELELTLGMATPGAVVIVDDTDHRYATKGDKAVPYARRHPEYFRILEDVEADRTCQGQIVLEVLAPQATGDKV